MYKERGRESVYVCAHREAEREIDQTKRERRDSSKLLVAAFTRVVR